MNHLRHCIVFGLALCASAVLAEDPPAPNSRLVIIEGSVLLNQGEQFADAAVDTLTKQGDRVMAMEGARAVIHFDDNIDETDDRHNDHACDLKVDPGTVITVPDRSPCAGGIVSVEKVAPSGGATAGGSTLLRPSILIPAIIVGACLAIDAGDDHLNCQDDPASP